MNTQITSASLRGATRPLALAVLIAAGLSSSAFAQTTWTWNGVDGEYTTGGNWDQATAPNLTVSGNVAVINSGNVTYTPGGDLAINNGGTLRINGGSWTQVVGNAWIQMGGGNLVVAGGTFNQGTAGNIIRNAGSSVTISSGAANFNGEFANSGALTISGGNVSIQNNFVANTGTVNISGGAITVGGELKFQGADMLISGGTISAALISFDATAASFDISGGTINLSGNFTDGIFANSPDAYLNFTLGSTGELHLASVSTTGAANLLGGRIRLDDTIDSAAFEIVSDGAAGSIISLVGSNIPEPSSFAALAGLGVLGFVASRRRRAAN
jgi:fibronectin-binding autotransporter adhesin